MSGFVDEAQLHVKAGDGGAGAVSFRREAHVSKGGPDGGDGGSGGDVWLVATTDVASLLAFRDHPHRRASDGTHGGGKKRHGRAGADTTVAVPEGTVVRTLSGDTVARPGDSGWPVVGGSWRTGRARERPLPVQPAAGAVVRRAGRDRRGALARSRAEAHGRRGPRRLAQRRQEHAHLTYLGGHAQDRGLPLHDPRAPSRCGARRLRRDRAWSWPTSPASWTGPVPARVSVTGSSATSSGPGCWWSWSTWPRWTARPAEEQERILLHELGRYRPELLDRPRLVVGSKVDLLGPDLAQSRPGEPARRMGAGAAHLGGDRSRRGSLRRPPAHAGDAGPGGAARHPSSRLSSTVPSPRASTSSGPMTAGTWSVAGLPNGPWP